MCPQDKEQGIELLELNFPVLEKRQMQKLAFALPFPIWNSFSYPCMASSSHLPGLSKDFTSQGRVW
jgi:hypothetical protein